VIPPPARGDGENRASQSDAPLLPPSARSRAALGLTAAAALGAFKLQVCTSCKAVQYPAREACHVCLSIKLDWRPADGLGELIAETKIRHSHDPFFRERLPWRIGMVRLDAGPTAIAHLHGECGPAPTRVRLQTRLDKSGQGVLVAFPIDKAADMSDDQQLREMTSNPRSRKILVTDGDTASGEAIVHALVAAGAATVWVGHAQPVQKSARLEALRLIPQVILVALDATESDSVKVLAGEIATRTDILINNSEVHRALAPDSGIDFDLARTEIDVNYLGLMRLAREFGPGMRAHAGDGTAYILAWVNLLSVFALGNLPTRGTFSAAMAAASSLSQYLRAEMRPAGVRVINVFPGPIDDDWNQSLPAPKLVPAALAEAVVAALSDGVEDVYPGDVAQEWLARWEESRKVLEKELGIESESRGARDEDAQ